MPVSYDFLTTDRIMTWSVSDPVSAEDWITAFDAAERDPELLRTRPVGMIVDNRGRMEFALAQAVQAFARGVRGRLARMRVSHFPVAVIVSSKVAHGMTRVASSYIGDALNVQIFLEAGAARQWILQQAAENHPAG